MIATSELSKGSDREGEHFGRQLVEMLPMLRNYATKLCGNGVEAEDLAQEAVTRGWQARASFEPGTNLKSWLLTILRNRYFSQFRKRRREFPLDDHDMSMPGDEAILAAAELRSVARAMTRLSPDQRDLLVFTGQGHSCAEVAEHLQCPLGTAKSRISRSRAALRAVLEARPSRHRSLGRDWKHAASAAWVPM